MGDPHARISPVLVSAANAVALRHSLLERFEDAAVKGPECLTFYSLDADKKNVIASILCRLNSNTSVSDDSDEG